MELLDNLKPNIPKTFYIISKCCQSNTCEMKSKVLFKDANWYQASPLIYPNLIIWYLMWH